MNSYARTYDIGNNPKVARRTKAKTVAPPDGRFCNLDGKGKRRFRNPKGQTAVCPDNHVANGFLRTAFLPRLQESETLQACEQYPEMVAGFFRSLSLVAQQYGLKLRPSVSLGYPDCIAIALSGLRGQLKSKGADADEIRLVENGERVFLAKGESYCTGMTLYYIPVVPIYDMLQGPTDRHIADLVLSVCAYLYHIADVPYYRQERSYLFSMYEMIEEWKLDEDDSGNIDEELLRETEHAENIGDFIEGRLANPENLDRFRERVDNFQGTSEQDREFWELADKFYALYQQYPDQTIYSRIRDIQEIEDFEDDMDERVIRVDMYVSFFASSKGTLSDILIDSVNVDLQESCLIEEPTIYIPFDETGLGGETLDFEKRLFPLMEDLIYLLNNYK